MIASSTKAKLKNQRTSMISNHKLESNMYFKLPEQMMPNMGSLSMLFWEWL